MSLKKLPSLVIGFVLFFLINVSTYADGIGFSQKPIPPDNQKEGVTGYFDLQVKPGSSQELQIELTNSSEQEITVLVDINNATTSDNGDVQYGGTEKPKDSSLPVSFEDLVVYEKEVVLTPKTTVIYPIKLTLPKESFDGILLGGIQFKQKDTKAEDEKKKGSLQIVNKYSYEVGIQLRETDVSVKPSMKLLDVKASQFNYRNAVKATLQNSESAAITNLSVTGKVYKENGSKVLYEQTSDNMTMAPNSNFDFGIMWGTDEFRAGKYRFEGKATSAEGEWDFKQNFEITNTEAKKLNTEAVELKKDNRIVYLLIGISLVVFIIMIVVMTIIVKRRHAKKQKRNNKKQGSKKTTHRKRKTRK